jgi:hypothetical protein
MLPLAAVLAALVGAIPPLSDEQRIAIETAFDGRDHREAAFVALIDHARSWTPGLGEAAVRLDPDLGALVAAPAASRGDLVRIVGRLEQVHRLGPPYEATEWAVRNDADQVALVYLPDAPAFDRGERVEVFARFYKRVVATDRSGAERAYAGFVGAHPRLLAPATSAMAMLVPLVVPVAVMLVVLVVLITVVRRQSRRGAPVRVRAAGEPAIEADAALPTDPAEALGELRRRAGRKGEAHG